MAPKAMDWTLVKNKLDSTPAFVLDENKIVNNLTQLSQIKELSGCQVLYSIKALPLEFVLNLTKDYLNGFSVSSLFEARIAKEILVDTGSIHMTTPGFRDGEFKQLTELCSHISFNSMSQYHRLSINNTIQCSLGLRFNPKLSFVNDLRFDPCRPYSKLGIDREALKDCSALNKIEGLHFHTVFSNTDYIPLVETISLLKKTMAKELAKLKWLNLGGGYLYNQITDHQPFINLVKELKAEFDLDIYIEPGKAVVGNAGYLVSTVIDQFSSDGKNIAVLDTSVNHNPEVFEYQQKPQLNEQVSQGEFSCLLVGSSCLAGDLFGEYQFETPPMVGDRLVFSNVGAYSLIKANRFNGYNLPAVYTIDKQKNIELVKQSSYQDYREQWMG